MRTIRLAAALILLVAATSFFSIPTADAQGRHDTIAQTGDLTPDENGTFIGFLRPELNNLGQLVFRNSISLNNGGTGIGIIRSDGLALTTMVATGDSAPDGNGVFSSFTGLEFNNSGQILFRGTLSGTNGGTSDDTGLFRFGGGAAVTIVREGDSAPGPGGGEFGLFFGQQISDSGEVAIRTVLTNTNSPPDDRHGIYRGNGAGTFRIVRTGDNVPVGIGTFDLLGIAQINNQGFTVFTAGMTGTPNGVQDNSGIFATLGGGLIEIVRKGDLIPDGAGTYDLFRDA